MTIYVRNFVELANRRHAEVVTAEHRKNLVARRESQRRAIEAAEERQKMLAKIAQIKF